MVLTKIGKRYVDVRMDKITARLIQILLAGHTLSDAINVTNEQFSDGFPPMNTETGKALLRQAAFALIPAVGGVDIVCIEPNKKPLAVMPLPPTIQ